MNLDDPYDFFSGLGDDEPVEDLRTEVQKRLDTLMADLNRELSSHEFSRGWDEVPDFRSTGNKAFKSSWDALESCKLRYISEGIITQSDGIILGVPGIEGSEKAAQKFNKIRLGKLRGAIHMSLYSLDERRYVEEGSRASLEEKIDLRKVSRAMVSGGIAEVAEQEEVDAESDEERGDYGDLLANDLKFLDPSHPEIQHLMEAYARSRSLFNEDQWAMLSRKLGEESEEVNLSN